MPEETSTPKSSKTEPDEVIRDLVQPQAPDELDQSDGPRDPTTQDRGDLVVPTIEPTETETGRKPIVIDPQADPSSSSHSNSENC
jgi:hypothetical protein